MIFLLRDMVLSSHKKSQVNIMEGFFDREVKRLEYVAERQQLRNNQKKELDAAMAAKEQVVTYVVISNHKCSAVTVTI